MSKPQLTLAAFSPEAGSPLARAATHPSSYRTAAHHQPQLKSRSHCAASSCTASLLPLSFHLDRRLCGMMLLCSPRAARSTSHHEGKAPSAEGSAPGWCGWRAGHKVGGTQDMWPVCNCVSAVTAACSLLLTKHKLQDLLRVHHGTATSRLPPCVGISGCFVPCSPSGYKVPC